MHTLPASRLSFQWSQVYENGELAEYANGVIMTLYTPGFGKLIEICWKLIGTSNGNWEINSEVADDLHRHSNYYCKEVQHSMNG